METKTNVFWVMFGFLVVLGLSGNAIGQSCTITQITNNSDDWFPGLFPGPQIDGGIITWEGGGGNFLYETNIFMYEIETGTTTKITNNNNSEHPKIDGGIITWEGYDGSDFEIFMYDIITGTATQITNNSNGDWYQQIRNWVITWEGYDGSDFEIFMYDIITGTTTQITNNSYDDWSPQIGNEVITWSGNDGSDFEIFIYNITTGTTTQITNNSNTDYGPQADDLIITWWGNENGGSDDEIFMYNIVTGAITQITKNGNVDSIPQADDGIITWWGNDGIDWEIFMYNITTGATTQITNNGNNGYPQADDGIITWSGSDGIDYEVFMYDIRTKTTTQITKNNGVGSQIDKGIITWIGYDGSHEQIFMMNYTACYYCTPNLVNTSWVPVNSSPCLPNNTVQWRIYMRTQYDSNSCNKTVNITYYMMNYTACSPAPVLNCGCGNGIRNYTCGETINTSCTLNCNLNSNGTCFTVGANNLVIDGSGYRITGNTIGYGIIAGGGNNITIKNFNLISNFNIGIYLNSSSSNNTLINNTANNNVVGIALDSSSNNNINNNSVCNNINNDFYSTNWFGSSGNNNTCSKPDGWNDTGKTGCTFVCPVQPTECTCNSCDDCEAKLNNPGCPIVKLNTNVTNQSGGCINDPENFSNKIFDCQGHTIGGNSMSSGFPDVGIYLSDKKNNTIKNCIINDFSYGIYLRSSSNNILTSNTANHNYYGILLQSSSNNILTSNIVSSSTYGIRLDSSSNNILTSNTANLNNYYGIFLVSASNNILTSNTANLNKYGISLWSSSKNNTLASNTANLNNYYGIYILDNSNYNKISNNKISNNNETGITISNCDVWVWGYCYNGNSNNTIEENEILNNKIGIYSNTSNSTIHSNTVCGNTQLDFNSSNWLSSFGDDNNCNKPDGWNDYTKIGCKHLCVKCNSNENCLDNQVCNLTANACQNLTCPEGQYLQNHACILNNSYCFTNNNCSPNQICNTTTHACYAPKCTDGTPYGQCSATQPKYCSNGILIDNCSLCGNGSCVVVSGAVISVIAPSTVYVGGSFTAKIVLSNVSDLAGAQFNLTFNSSVVRVIGHSSGNLTNSGASITNNTNNAAGKDVMIINNAGASTGSGSIVLITFEIVSLEGSSTHLNLSNLKLSNSVPEPIPVAAVNNAKILVTPIHPGDSNGDGAIDIFDVIWAEKIAVGLPGPAVGNADADCDGDVDIFDVIWIEKIAVGLPGKC